MKTLYPYQRKGAGFLVTRPGAILGDDVGLGKTIQVIAAAAHLDLKRMLLVCPMNLKPWWRQEITEFEEGLGGKVVVEELPKKLWMLKVYRNGNEEPGEHIRVWVFAHFAMFSKSSMWREDLLNKQWDGVAIDELHFIKNPDAKRTRYLNKVKTQHRWGTTASPVADKPPDLWSLLNWVAPGQFGGQKQFVYSFCYYTGTRWRLYTHAADRLSKLVAPYLLVRTREDVGVELPELTVQDVELPMEEDQALFYNEIETQMVVELQERAEEEAWDLDHLENQLVISCMLARITRLHQCASAPTVHKAGVSNTKAEWFANWLEGGGPPCVIMSRYRHTCDVVREVIAAYRPDDCDEFLVGTYESLSHGHNLQHFNILIMWDLSYRRLLYEQSIGRIKRPGQRKAMHVYRLLAEQTLDRDVLRTVEGKEEMVDMLRSWMRRVVV